MDAHLRGMGRYRDEADPLGALLRSPMLRLAIPFLLGLLLARVLHVSVAACWAMVIAGAVAGALAMRSKVPYGWRWLTGATMAFTWAAVGLLWQSLHQERLSGGKDMAGVFGPWLVQLRTVSTGATGITRAEAEVLAMAHEGGSQAMGWRVSLVMLPDPVRGAPRVSDRMWVFAEPRAISRVADPGGFDSRAWAASKGITHEMLVRPEDRVTLGVSQRWTDLFLPARERVTHWLHDTGLPKRERAIVKALVLGSRDELDDSQRNAFARSGTMHVLAVSGMHVGLIYGIFAYLLGWMGAKPRARLIRGLLLVLLLWCYAGLTGASPSVMRASTMFTLFAVADMMGRRSASLNALFGAAVLLLLLDPQMLGQLSFQFSFLAVLGIVLFYDPLRRLWVPPGRITAAAWSLVAVSVAAQLATTPLALFTFKAFPVWFLPANLVVVFQVSAAVCSGAVLLLLHKLPFIGEWASWLVTWQLRFLGASTDLFAGLPGAYPDIRINTAGLLIMYGLVAAGAAWALLGSIKARTVFLLLLAAAFINWAHLAHQRNTRTAFVLYDMREGVLASMVHGRSMDLLMDEGAAYSGKTAVKVENHQRGEGVRISTEAPMERLMSDTPDAMVNSVMGGGIWTANGIRVAFLGDGPLPPPETLEQLDALVLLPEANLSKEDVPVVVRSHPMLVIHAGVGYRTRNAVLKECADAGVSCHDVRSHGAFIMER